MDAISHGALLVNRPITPVLCRGLARIAERAPKPVDVLYSRDADDPAMAIYAWVVVIAEVSEATAGDRNAQLAADSWAVEVCHGQPLKVTIQAGSDRAQLFALYHIAACLADARPLGDWPIRRRPTVPKRWLAPIGAFAILRRGQEGRAAAVRLGRAAQSGKGFMAELIKCQRDGRVVLALESTPGFPAAELAVAKLGSAAVRIIPAELLGEPSEPEDMVVAVRRGSPAAQLAVKALDRKLPAVPASGYHLEVVEGKFGMALLIVGGDLFGMLAGLADALLWSSLTSQGLAYRGGTRTEKPAFPIRYYWTWDHSTNWVLDDPGNQISGCQNLYLKTPETFLQDYRRLIDHCLDMRCNGLVIWGFLRDAHGGERYADQIARYAADRGVRLLPGVGTTGYGGIYYEGHHPCNLETYLNAHPERANLNGDGRHSRAELSPYFTQNQVWIRNSVEWLYRNFPIGGANFENNDFMIDHSPLAKRERARIKTGELDQFKDQFAAYKTALETARELDPDAWNIYATYCGFGTDGDVTVAGPNVGPRPHFADHLPEDAIAQWTLTGMLTPSPPKLREWLDHEAPKKLYRNRHWPRKLEPPTARSVGYLHQGTQWHGSLRRTALCIKPFAEAALRGYECGLEGVGIHGEVSSRTLPWLLNYLTMRHWTYHPKTTLAEFAKAELAPRLGGLQEARDFVEALCLVDEDKTDGAVECCRDHFMASYPKNYPVCGDLPISRLWEGLLEMCYQSSGNGPLNCGTVDVM